jgi:hypothetical protein
MVSVSFILRAVGAWMLVCSVLVSTGYSAPVAPDQAGTWGALIQQARHLKLPTAFLERMPPDFVTIEFEGLRFFSSEYHLEDHRLVLNRTLSLNEAGRVLRPLATIPPRDLGTLYHELFHAYLDYLLTYAEKGESNSIDGAMRQFANQVQQCRYQVVEILPVKNRKLSTEQRFLTEIEAWEVLHETWAVFVGWTVWNALEIKGASSKSVKEIVVGPTWQGRLRKADQEAELIGYYEPATSAERAVTQKRYLSPAFRLSRQEANHLLTAIFDLFPIPAERVAGGITASMEGAFVEECGPAKGGG